MKLKYHKVIEQIPLSDYHKDYGKKTVHVWLNLPRKMIAERDKLDREISVMMIQDRARRIELAQQLSDSKTDDEKQSAIDAAEEYDAEAAQAFQQFKDSAHAWFSVVWSQGPKNTHWPIADIKELEEQDQRLLEYLTDRTRTMQRIRVVEEKKG